MPHLTFPHRHRDPYRPGARRSRDRGQDL